MNHSCTPNVDVTSGSQLGCIIVRALKDIKRGEEMNWDYTSGRIHSEILELWNIDCECNSEHSP